MAKSRKKTKTVSRKKSVSSKGISLFTTHIMPPSRSSVNRRTQNALAKTFQVDIAKLKALNADGSESTETFAMDEVYENLQSAKYINRNGGLLPLPQLEWYSSQGFIGWQTCAILAQNWLIDKACTMPAKDAVRHGWEISVNDGVDIDPKIIDDIRRYDKKYKLKKQCIEFIKNGRIFGIRHAMFIVESDDPKYYEKPFNPDGVMPGSYKGISQIDPYWVAPELDREAAANPAAQDFYEPTWWRINGKRVHRSHMVIMRNGDQVTDILKPSYMYGGIPTPQKIYERVYAAERTANEAPLLAMSKRLTTIKLDTAMALQDMEKFNSGMEFFSQTMNNFGIKIIGMSDELQQFDTNLTGLDETIMTQYQLVAAAANVPSTKLLGTTPKGFNATGDYEQDSYHEELESIQENDLSPLIERHHLLVIRSYIAPKHGIKPFNSEVNWRPVDSPTAEEQADINAKKADTDSKLVQAGAIDGTDVRQRLIADPDSGYNGIAEVVPGGPGDREAQQEAEEALEQPVQANNKGKSEQAPDEDKE